MVIVYGVVMENLINFCGDDLIYVNNVVNKFSGYILGKYIGNDKIFRIN